MKLLNEFKKISWRLTFIYSIIFLIVTICVDLFVLLSLNHYFASNEKREFQHIVEEISNELFREIDYQELHKIENQDVVEDFKTFLVDYRVKVTDPNGKLIGISDEIKGVKLPEGVKEGRYIKFKYKKMSYLYYKKIVRHHGKVLACLEIVKDISDFVKIQDFMSVISFFSMGFGAAISLLGGLFMTKQILKPIDDLTRVANKITIGNLNERLEVKDIDDELTNLAKTFNSMLERLEQAVKCQSQFVSDASHELRTPIAIIQGYTNLLNRWGTKDEQVCKEAILAIKDETDNMSRLIEKLLQAAKGDEGQPLEIQQFNWDELIGEVVKESRLIAPNLAIIVSRNPKVTVNGDRCLLKRMLRIFLDNSIKYTPENGSINIETSDLGAGIEFHIADTGIGIPANELDKVFNRFYMVDKARNKNQSGHGLGLYIARQIVTLHHGTIKLESELGKGTTVKVYLPVNQSDN